MRGWSLILMLVCGTGYAFYGQGQKRDKRPSRAAPKRAAKSNGSIAPSVATTFASTSATNFTHAIAADPEVAARVNGVSIPTADLTLRAQPYFDKVRPRDRSLTAEETDRLYTRVRWHLLDAMIADEIVTQAVREAEDKGAIKLDATILPESLVNVLKTYPTEAAFQAAHPQTRLARDAWVRRFLLWGQLTQSLTKAVTATPEEVRRYYDKNPGRWRDPGGNSLSFEQAQAQVERDLLNDKRNATVKDWLRKRRESAQIDVALAAPTR